MNEELFKKWVKAIGLTDKNLVQAFDDALKSSPNADGILKYAEKTTFPADKMLQLLSAQGVNTGKIDEAFKGTSGQAEPTYTPVWAEAPSKAGKGSSRAERNRYRRSGQTPNRDEAKAEKEVTEEAEKPSGGGKKVLLVAVVAFVLLALAAGAFFMFSGTLSGSAYPSIDTSVYPTGETADPTITPEISPSSITVDPNESESLSEKKDRSFWSALVSKDVPELSPGNLNNQLSAKTAVGLILMVVLTLWSWGEGSIRRKSQQGANYFTILGLLAGWLTMPILVLITKASYPGWIMIGVMVVVWLWSNAASTVKSQSDLTPFLTALGLFTATLFYYGKLIFISTLGALFGATWAPWTGVTTVFGAFTLLFTGRGMEALLTILIIILGITVIVLASLEVGKKHGKGSAFFIALLILLVFGLGNWGLTAGVEYLVQAQNTSVIVTAVLNILAPILAWIFSLLAAVGIGVAMGDTEVGRTENRQVLGLQKTGTFLQNIADFGILGTLIPLFFGVIIILF